MVARLEYDSYVERLNPATVAAIAVILLGFILLIFASPAAAQFNGTPASVTTGGGGRFNSAPGVPASVTSMGPNGVQPRPPCCINPLFPVNANPPLFPRHHPRRQSSFFPIGGAYYVPYPVPVETDTGDAAADANQEDDYRGGPTIFDRRGPGHTGALVSGCLSIKDQPGSIRDGIGCGSAARQSGRGSTPDRACLQRRPPAGSAELCRGGQHAV